MIGLRKRQELNLSKCSFEEGEGNIMYVTKAVDQINQNFIITNLILSMKGSFTCEDAAKEISKCSLNVSMKTVERTLKRLRDNDYLEEIGYSYKVIPQEESVRWGRNQEVSAPV